MKKLYPNLSLWFFPVLVSAFCTRANAQKVAPPALTQLMSRQITFIVHAPVILPSLLQQRQFQKMKNFLVNWKNADYPSPELIFGAEALLSMETGKFSSFGLSCDCMAYLTDYARELKEIGSYGEKFKYYLKLKPPYYYDATDNARKTIVFLQSWARDILRTRSPDSTGLFICRTLAGDIPDPKAALHASPQSCPRIVMAEKNLENYNNIVFRNERDGVRATAALTVGWWSPTGHLQVLGSHPSVGLILGGRNKRNEYTLNWNVRFGFPTPQPYVFVRQDTAYTSRYYDGGYIGFEYTRYFVHAKRIDLGYTSGIAYDYFSVADGWSEHTRTHYIVPLNVGSFDFDNGLRFKYFFHRSAYIGLTAKYHLIHYNNDGGTDLGGNAFTLDLAFGSH